MAGKYEPNLSFIQWKDLTVDDLWIFQTPLSVSSDCFPHILCSESTTRTSQVSGKWARWPCYSPLCQGHRAAAHQHCPSQPCTAPSWPSQPARPHPPAKSSFFHFCGFSGRAKSLLSLWRTSSFQRNFSIRVTVSQHVRGCEAAAQTAMNLYKIITKIMLSLIEWSDQWLRVINKKVLCLNPSISL